MGFVNREATPEEIKRFNIPLGNTRIAVDEELGCYLICIGRKSLESGKFYQIYLEKIIATLETIQTVEEKKINNNNFIYSVTHNFLMLNIDSDLAIDYIYFLIKEAFASYGLNGYLEKTESVTVNLPNPPVKVFSAFYSNNLNNIIKQ